MSSDDEGDSGAEQEVTLASIVKSRTINLNVSSDYTTWGPVEAFRELVQNWRDGIIRSFNLSEDQFKVVRNERSVDGKTHILYIVPHPKVATDCLGYIRFSPFDEEEGFVEVTNRKAVLQPRNLDLGSSSKREEDDQAGTHGEGLKLALLVLQRGDHNHAIRCTTGNVHWNFDFSNLQRLVARLGKMTHAQIDNEQKASQVLLGDGIIPFAPSSSKDVQFLIGMSTRKGRDENGVLRNRDRVHIDQFKLWCTSAIFLQDIPDNDIVRTVNGDLICNTKSPLCGNLYLKGLLLKKSTWYSSASVTGKPLKFGYNFQNGSTNRERQQIEGPNAESKAILSIWDQVVILKPEFIIHLHEMLITADSPNSKFPPFETMYADVAKPLLLERETVTCLKNHLCSGGKKWYYSTKEKAEDPRLSKIIHGLGFEGVELPNIYWYILSVFDFVRTAAEEEEQRFLEAPVTAVPNTAFSQEAHRLIRASLHGCTETRGMEVEFVKAGPLALNISLPDNDGPVKIHAKWLTKADSTRELGVTNTLPESSVLFHSISKLFSKILHKVCAGKSDEDEKERREHIGVQQRLLEYFDMKKHLSLLDESTLSCMTPRKRRNSTRTGANTAQGCLALTKSLSAGFHDFESVKTGESYFAVMLKPSEPNSIVVVSNVHTATGAQREISGSSGSSWAWGQAPRKSYTQGDALETLDIIESRDWFDAVGHRDGSVVIGISKEEPGSDRKRRRTGA